MNKTTFPIFIVTLLSANFLFSQKIIFSGPVKNSHFSKLNTVISKIRESRIKFKVYSLSDATVNPIKINLNNPLEYQISPSDKLENANSKLINQFAQSVLIYKKKYPKKNLTLVCLSKFEEKIPLPYGCQRVDYSEYIENFNNYNSSIVILGLTPNSIEFELEKPDVKENLDKSVIDLKGNIKSDAAIQSVRYQFGSKGWQVIDNESIINQGGTFSFWVQNQWPFKGNINEYISIEIVDIEGNSKKYKFGPFKLTEIAINPNNCFFKYYQKDVHDEAMVRNFRSSNVYWFPIYSEIDPSNLSFVLIDDLGREHISIRLVEDINFTRNSTNEFCLGIACGDLNIGHSNCDCKFNGKCYLRNNLNQSKSEPIEIHLKDWKPSYIAPLAECTK